MHIVGFCTLPLIAFCVYIIDVNNIEKILGIFCKMSKCGQQHLCLCVYLIFNAVLFLFADFIEPWLRR